MKPKFTLWALAIVGLIALAVAIHGQTPLKTCGGGPEVQALRGAFNTLPPAKRAAIFAAHLQNQLAIRDASLTPAQKTFIQFWIANYATEKFYTDTSGIDREDLQQRMRALFPLDVGQQIFERIDPDVMFAVAGVRAEPVVASPTGLVQDCACSTFWTFCGWPGGCSMCDTKCSGGCSSCTQVINCGPGWGFQCNGLCTDNGCNADLKNGATRTVLKKPQ